MRIWIHLLLALTVWSAGYDADPMHVSVTSPIRRRLLIPTAAAHGNEVAAKNGERWLALLRTPSGYKTEMVNLHITAVPDPLVDDPENRAGKRVGMKPAANPVLLLNGYAHLRDRSIATSFDGNFKLVPNSPVSLHLAGRRFELQLQPNGKVDQAPGSERVELFQVNMKVGYEWIALPIVATEKYNSVELVWAGDLDGDGKVDLLFEDGGYNWTSLRLFLSSAAKPGQIVGEVAQFYQSGC